MLFISSGQNCIRSYLMLNKNLLSSKFQTETCWSSDELIKCRLWFINCKTWNPKETSLHMHVRTSDWLTSPSCAFQDPIRVPRKSKLEIMPEEWPTDTTSPAGETDIHRTRPVFCPIPIFDKNNIFNISVLKFSFYIKLRNLCLQFVGLTSTWIHNGQEILYTSSYEAGTIRHRFQGSDAPTHYGF